jgi:hypothetical protein
MGRRLSYDAPPSSSSNSRDEEIMSLRALAADLRQQLADAVERIEKLEKEN